METNDLREALAALCHEQWRNWTNITFGECPDLITPQMLAPYFELSEEDKESNRKEADKIIELLEKQKELKLTELLARIEQWDKEEKKCQVKAVIDSVAAPLIREFGSIKDAKVKLLELMVYAPCKMRESNTIKQEVFAEAMDRLDKACNGEEK